jgi:hypothetical protein
MGASAPRTGAAWRNTAALFRRAIGRAFRGCLKNFRPMKEIYNFLYSVSCMSSFRTSGGGAAKIFRGIRNASKCVFLFNSLTFHSREHTLEVSQG